MNNRSHALINEPPLLVCPTLAVMYGLNEAMMVQQIHFWSSAKNSGRVIDGRVWVYNTAEEWQEQFPFLSLGTVVRVLKSIRDKGIVDSLILPGSDRTLHYAINYDKINAGLEAIQDKANCEDHSRNLRRSSKQIAKTKNNADCEDHLRNLRESYTETTSETTTENTTHTAHEAHSDTAAERVEDVDPFLPAECHSPSPYQDTLGTTPVEPSPLSSTAAQRQALKREAEDRKKKALALIQTFASEVSPGGTITDGFVSKHTAAAHKLLSINATPEELRRAIANQRIAWPSQRNLTLAYIEENWPTLTSVRSASSETAPRSYQFTEEEQKARRDKAQKLSEEINATRERIAREAQSAQSQSCPAN